MLPGVRTFSPFEGGILHSWIGGLGGGEAGGVNMARCSQRQMEPMRTQRNTCCDSWAYLLFTAFLNPPCEICLTSRLQDLYDSYIIHATLVPGTRSLPFATYHRATPAQHFALLSSLLRFPAPLLGCSRNPL